VVLWRRVCVVLLRVVPCLWCRVGVVCGVVLGVGFLSCAVSVNRRWPCVSGAVVAEFWWCCRLLLLVVGDGVLLCLVTLRCCYVYLGWCCGGGMVPSCS
jgi:hypothetical protein